MNIGGIKYCKKHGSDGTPSCFTCDRLKIQGQMEYVNFENNRKLCSDCYSIAILNPSNCNRLVEKMHKFYKELDLEVDKNIPILLIDEDEMERIQPLEKRAVGLTLTTTPRPNRCMLSYMCGFHQSIDSGYSVMTIANCSKNGYNIQVEKEKKLIKRKGSILLLFGLPKVTMGRILAHEMMHAWLYLQGCTNLDKTVCEGICEATGHQWLDWFCEEEKNSLEQTQFTRTLKTYLADKMTVGADKIYGHGFREAKWAISKYDLHKTLQHIVRYKRLPL